MTGVDLSPQMVELGRQEELREPLGIRYAVGSYAALTSFADETFDVVVSFMALMDGPDLLASIREMRRVLRSGGTLIFNILHPCFATRGAGWVFDEDGHASALKVSEYFNDQLWVDSWKFAARHGDDRRVETWKIWRRLPEQWKLWRRLPERWHFLSALKLKDANKFSIPRFSRTLADYVNSVIKAGLVLNEIAEPRPTEEACRICPWLERYRIHSSLYLYLRAVKSE